jgi:DNA-binding Lrp family transcriptional regulator
MSDAPRNDYDDGHLLVAAVRVLTHREGRPPSVEEAAKAIGMSREVGHHLVRRLAALGIVRLVETPFEARLIVEDHTRLEEIPRGEAGPAIASEFEMFKAKQDEKQRALDHLFGEGVMEKKRKDRVTSLEEQFKKFRETRRYRPPEKGGEAAGAEEDDENPQEPA